MSEVDAPVNVTRVPQLPSLEEVGALGVARVSWGIALFQGAMTRFGAQLASLRS